ncbi:hypothetical protein ABZ570_23635 [Micromonospora sp. NPDC007271]|uniref:hypothetical protein n=1 Tax=Micromonospora sp. NPDC007271 TaxID=3154587 RepID=UPI0033EDC43D
MTTHPSLAAIAEYAGGGRGLDEATVWSIEVHLEDCAECRARLAGSAAADTLALLDRVSAGLDREIAAGPAPARRTRRWLAPRRRWLVAALLPWVTMTVAVLLCALGLNRLLPELPSLVLLLAPVAPLPGVAAAWSRRLDPAGELIASTPAAGLTMLLRRTLVVLAVIVPALALLGTGTRTSLALMLLPCLAFTAGTIALGALIGVPRAAVGLGTLWALAVVVPTVITEDLPVVLRPGSAVLWALTAVVLVGVAMSRAGDFRRLTSHR